VRRNVAQYLDRYRRCFVCEVFESPAVPLFADARDRLLCQRCRDRTYPRSTRAKELARSAVTHAVRSGVLTKPRHCQACGDSGRLCGHHADYTRPLDVTWLCLPCHAELHRELRALQKESVAREKETGKFAILAQETP
jgi:hypothetical protein